MVKVLLTPDAAPQTVRDLIHKRGFARAAAAAAAAPGDGEAAPPAAGRGRRVALTDNEIVERGLGKVGIVCLEDLVHEIHRLFNNHISFVIF